MGCCGSTQVRKYKKEFKNESKKDYSNKEIKKEKSKSNSKVKKYESKNDRKIEAKKKCQILILIKVK